MELRRFLVPTDFSDAALRAFDQALALASSRQGEILLLHRLPSPIPCFAPPVQPGMGATPEMGRFLDDYVGELRKEAVRSLAELGKRAPEGVTVQTEVEERLETPQAILHRASEWKPDLIVMGTHGRRGLDRLLMGSVAEAVLHRAENDVLLVRPDSELFALGPDAGIILVPVDFSEHSHRALALARQVASSYGGHLHLLHVVELLQTPFKPGGLTSRFEESPELRDKLREALQDMLGREAGEVTVGEGTTIAGEILWWREKLGARLVVMGSRGLSGLKHLLLGSVTEKTARFCEVPVLVVK